MNWTEVISSDIAVTHVRHNNEVYHIPVTLSDDVSKSHVRTALFYMAMRSNLREYWWDQ